MKKKIFAANWKLNKNPEEARQFVIQFKNEIFKHKSFFDSREVIIFPTSVSLEAVASLCGSTLIHYGPQNIYSEKSGAFTGETSAQMALELKSEYALVGHSERREIFQEANSLLNKKTALLQQLDMTPVFCIGESLAQRESHETFKVCTKQLQEGLKDLNKTKRIIIAYEPIWAIGTGKVASIQQVAETHLELFNYMTSEGFTNFQLLYGGSVKPENANELLQIPHVDGFLIGGASLQVDSFLKVCLA